MTQEEIIQAISDDKTMPFIQPDQLARIVDFVSENYKPSLPEGLEEAAKEYATKWHKRPDGSEWKSIYPAGTTRDFITGAEWMKAKMLEDAIDIEVKEDAGGYPYIVATELYDYENDKTLAKAGDKVRIVFLKEEE